LVGQSVIGSHQKTGVEST